MSKYPLNDFLSTVDRDPDLIERYLAEPADTFAWWEAEMANRILNCHSGEASTWLAFDDDERAALIAHDYPTLFTLGAHPLANCPIPTSRPDGPRGLLPSRPPYAAPHGPRPGWDHRRT
jgi:hypothetical protein